MLSLPVPLLTACATSTAQGIPLYLPGLGRGCRVLEQSEWESSNGEANGAVMGPPTHWVAEPQSCYSCGPATQPGSYQKAPTFTAAHTQSKL